MVRLLALSLFLSRDLFFVDLTFVLHSWTFRRAPCGDLAQSEVEARDASTLELVL